MCASGCSHEVCVGTAPGEGDGLRCIPVQQRTPVCESASAAPPVLLEKTDGRYKVSVCGCCSSGMPTEHQCQHSVEGSSIIDPEHGEICGAPFCAMCMDKWNSEDRTKCGYHLGLEEEAPGGVRSDRVMVEERHNVVTGGTATEGPADGTTDGATEDEGDGKCVFVFKQTTTIICMHFLMRVPNLILHYSCGTS